MKRRFFTQLVILDIPAIDKDMDVGMDFPLIVQPVRAQDRAMRHQRVYGLMDCRSRWQIERKGLLTGQQAESRVKIELHRIATYNADGRMIGRPEAVSVNTCRGSWYTWPSKSG